MWKPYCAAYFASDALPQNVIEVWNKIDLIPPTVGGRLGLSRQSETAAEGGLACSELALLAPAMDAPTPTLPLMGRELGISALTGEGVDALSDFLSRELRRLHLQEEQLTLPINSGKALAWLHAHASVTKQEVVDDEAFALTVHITPENLARFKTTIYTRHNMRKAYENLCSIGISLYVFCCVSSTCR